ncbi:MAG: glycosyltransferase [Candidatus Obscuribacterales bacterium]|nr:glycosyltransferase [Candidatus Obscuribacterales bacterium]
MANLHQKPLVSIITPCYNQQQFLPTLFESLLDQTYENIELVFMDDASPDKSWLVASTYEKALKAKFSNVYMKTNKKNLGVLENLKKGCALATGEYMCYLEADDYYRHDKIERNLEFFELNPTYGAVHSDYYQVNEDLRVIPRFAKRVFPESAVLFNNGWMFDTLLEKNPFCAPTVLMKAEFFRRAFQFDLFIERDYRMADYPAFIILSQMTKIGFIDEPLVYYRVLEVSLSHSPNAGERQAIADRVKRVQKDAITGRLKPTPLDIPKPKFA